MVRTVVNRCSFKCTFLHFTIRSFVPSFTSLLSELSTLVLFGFAEQKVDWVDTYRIYPGFREQQGTVDDAIASLTDLRARVCVPATHAPTLVWAKLITSMTRSLCPDHRDCRHDICQIKSLQLSCSVLGAIASISREISILCIGRMSRSSRRSRSCLRYNIDLIIFLILSTRINGDRRHILTSRSYVST